MMYSRRFIPHRIAEGALRASRVKLEDDTRAIEVSGAELLDAKVLAEDDAHDGWRVGSHAFGVVFQHPQQGSGRFRIDEAGEAGALVHDIFRFILDDVPRRSVWSLLHNDLYYVTTWNRIEAWCTQSGELFLVRQDHWESSESALVTMVALWKEDWLREQDGKADLTGEIGDPALLAKARETWAKGADARAYRIGLPSYDLGWVRQGLERTPDLADVVTSYQRFLRRHPHFANEYALEILRREDDRRNANAHRGPYGSRRTPDSFDPAERDRVLLMLCLPLHVSTALAHRELREISNQLAITSHDVGAGHSFWGHVGKALTVVVALLILLLALAAYAVFRGA